MNFNIADSCNRFKQSSADYVHMLWSCPKLSLFWSATFDTLGEVLGGTIDSNPLAALSGVPLTPDMPDASERVITFTTLHARRLICFCFVFVFIYTGLPINTVNRLQNAAARVLTGTKKIGHIRPVLKNLHWLPFQYRIDFNFFLLLVHRAVSCTAPQYLSDLLTNYHPIRSLRSSDMGLLNVP